MGKLTTKPVCAQCGYVEDGQNKSWTITVEGKWQCDDCWQLEHLKPEMNCDYDCTHCISGEQVCQL